MKPCLRPLLAVLEEAKLVAQFWLRAGNRVVQQQRRRLHFRVALQFAAPYPAAAGAGRQRLLRRWLAFAPGKPAPAALSLAVGWLDRVAIGTLRFRLFSTAGIISQAQGHTTIKLGIPLQNRSWWRADLAQASGRNPHCNAVAQTP